MLALVKAEESVGLWMRDVPTPEIMENEVLIKIHKTGICGTDLHIWNWDGWAQKNIPVPQIVGHEYSGVIVELGRNVKNLRLGQRVTGEGHLVDLNCRASRAGCFHLDPHTRSVGVNHPGAFAEYLALPAFNVVPLPDEIDDELGAILDPLGNAVHTALAFDVTGNDVVITGAGPVGIMAAAVARHAGAGRIFIADLEPFRLDLACRLVDVIPIDIRQNSLADAARLYGLKEGYDIGFEMSGSSSALDSLIESIATGGRLACLGLPAASITIKWEAVVCKSLRIEGIYGREMFETWRKMLSMLSGGLQVKGIITHRFAVENFSQAFNTMSAGQSGKIILNWC
ncbi:L-threonine 3-dehydrogenase [Pseudomonas sp. MSSRFD41]|uniref:L-threonine 3-dehydrogenase n=1 Tax=Pseudomonas sp. MSSRFD41 TaxID=1310370 RepID=UPI00163B3A1D|nr:L-threonine 3-dehydrogenase [Pseudomonas sp. MSSRFD41]MBC2655836.1 L-threonine 3-dehydrogenase [Pseudomonas sp. MSSRFD41]